MLIRWLQVQALPVQLMTAMDDYEVVDAVYNLPVREVYIDSGFNCRGFFAPQSVHDLALSIRDHGLLEPVVVQPFEDVETEVFGRTLDHKWRLVAGHRREAAVRFFLRWEQIPARIVRGLTTEQAQTVNFLENLDRQDLNILQEAQAIDRIWPNESDRALCKRLKRYGKWVRIRRKLVKMPDEIQQAAASGRVTQRDIEFIGRTDEEIEQLQLFKGIIETKTKKIKDGPRHKDIEWTAANKTTRTKKEIGAMLTYLMEVGIECGRPESETGSLISVLAWAMRGITANELLLRLNLPFDEEGFDD